MPHPLQQQRNPLGVRGPSLFGPGSELGEEELAALAARDFGAPEREIEAGFSEELPPSLQALQAQGDRTGRDILIRRDSPSELSGNLSRFATARQAIGQNQTDIARANQMAEAGLEQAQGVAAAAQPGFQLELAGTPRRTESTSDVTQDITQDLTNTQGITPELAASRSQVGAIGGLEAIGRTTAGLTGLAPGITETLQGLADPAGAEANAVQSAAQQIADIARQRNVIQADPATRRALLEQIASEIINIELARQDGSLEQVLQLVEQQLSPLAGLASATP
ncbi:hypothetical protein LCGC14_0521070 [marine sediment metagenome]|uniref:Uncharacterized protein n=1 Tax=marine sediment metagenome TaxID=412755 RepID=A0A0F9S380_9ZZZZ